MDEMPQVFATSSGLYLAKKIAISLTELMMERYEQISKSRRRTSREIDERQYIEAVMERNAYLFGNEGEFEVRHASTKLFSDTDVKYVVEDYQLREGGQKISNSIRRQHTILISGTHEPKRTRQELIRTIEKRENRTIDDITDEEADKIIKEARKDRSNNDNIMEALIAIRALKKCAAGRITWISPLHPYSRQDHAREREPATAKMIQEFFTQCGIDNGVFFDLHSDQIQSFYLQADNLRASAVLLPAVKDMLGLTDNPTTRDDVVAVSVDAGGAKRAKYYAKKLGTDRAYMDKQRVYGTENLVDKTEMRLVGNVKGKKALIVEDMVDTGGTIEAAHDCLRDNGAREVYVVAPHPILSGPATGRMNKLHTDGIFRRYMAIDSVNWSEERMKEMPWLTIKSVKRMCASTIYNSTRGDSVQDAYEGTGNVPVVSFQ